MVDAGGAIVGSMTPEVTVGMRAAAGGLVVCAMIYALGERSGAHFNPIVSLAFALRGAFPWRRVAPYVGAQLVGGVLGAALLRGAFGARADAGVTAPLPPFGPAIAAGAECVFSLLLTIVILATATQAKVLGPNAAVASGAVVGLCGLVGKAVSGASMNPARSLACAVVQGDLRHVALYVLAPATGALFATALMSVLHPGRRSAEVEAAMGKQNSDSSQ